MKSPGCVYAGVE